MSRFDQKQGKFFTEYVICLKTGRIGKYENFEGTEHKDLKDLSLMSQNDWINLTEILRAFCVQISKKYSTVSRGDSDEYKKST